MKGINWKPDESGVPCCTADQCNRFDATGKYPMCGKEKITLLNGKYCPPQLEKMVAALNGLLTCDSAKDSGNHWVDCYRRAKEAVKP